MDAKQVLVDLRELAALQLNPMPTYVYKPRPDGSGVALKLNLRLKPKFNTEEGFVEEADGGLFLEIVAQDGKTEDQRFAKFGWQNDAKKVTAKLGLNDQLALITSIRQVRYRGLVVPSALQPRNEADEKKKSLTVSLFHKFANSSTAINYNFAPEQSFLSVSKSANNRKSIALTLMEELQIETYLKYSLDAYIKLGLR